MKTLYMTKGLPASGKSTWAKKMIPILGAKRVNKDDLRAMLDDGTWSKQNEKFVLVLRDSIVRQSLNSGVSIIVDDTNLAPKHEATLRQIAQECKAEFELVPFTHVDVEECIARDRKRPNYVGEKVIRDMYDQFLAPPHPKAPPYNKDLPKCVIVDIDGTIAEMNGRGPYEWEKVGTDHVREVVRTAVLSFVEYGAKMVLVSGRDEGRCRKLTEDWLEDNNIFPHALFMRPAGDTRKDNIVKAELYEKHINGQYNVQAIFEDRNRVWRCWQSLGFADRIFFVGNGREF